MSSKSDGSIIGYIITSAEELGFYHMYVIGEGEMRNYSVSKSPITLDGYSTKITKLVISEGITSIGDSAFQDCICIVNINIPQSVTSIGSCAFRDCILLKNITMSENIKYIGGAAFTNTVHYNDTDNWYRNMYYIDNVLVLAKSTISGNHTLKSGTKTIVERAFYNCSELTGITIPNTVVAINSSAFYGCTKLASITFEANSRCKEIGDSAFSETKIKTISIPKTVAHIGSYVFISCSDLESINVEQGNTNYTSINGVLFNYDATVLLKCPVSYNQTQYVVPSTVTKIEDSAFSGVSLTSITITANVSEIGRYAFSGCSNLTIAIFENPVGWTMYWGEKTVEMTEDRMKNAAYYLTHNGMSYTQYTWIRQ